MVDGDQKDGRGHRLCSRDSFGTAGLPPSSPSRRGTISRYNEHEGDGDYERNQRGGGGDPPWHVGSGRVPVLSLGRTDAGSGERSRFQGRAPAASVRRAGRRAAGSGGTGAEIGGPRARAAL